MPESVSHTARPARRPGRRTERDLGCVAKSLRNLDQPAFTIGGKWVHTMNLHVSVCQFCRTQPTRRTAKPVDLTTPNFCEARHAPEQYRGTVLRLGRHLRTCSAHVRGRMPMQLYEVPMARFRILLGNFCWRAARSHLLSLGGCKSMKTW